MPTATPSTSFHNIAPYYDELMKGVPYRMWVGYYLLLLSVLESEPEHVLDVACGTGKMCEMLVAEGMKMTGIDLSPAMIQRAKQKAKRKGLEIAYEVADATNFKLKRTFDGALSFFDSLNNITEPANLQSAFAHVAKHLPPGGSWVFDLNTAYAFEHNMFNQQNLARKAKLRYKWEGDWDANARLITVRMKFWRGEQEFEEIHRQRAYEPDEVIAMLEEEGFTNIRAYHSYSLERPRKNSDRVHYAALVG